MKRIMLFTGLFLVLFAVPVFAGVMDVLKTAVSSGGLWAGLGAVVLLYVFKAIPNAKIYAFVEAFSARIGTVATLGLAKWKWSAPFWNKIIEPWFVDFIDNTAGAAIKGLITGLRSDNNGV